MHSGPCLNQKLITAILQLRFDPVLLSFDLRRAFLQLCVSDSDSSRLLFYWYKNVSIGDFSLVTYRNCRLPFGLRCSPFLLMISLYKILCLGSPADADRLKFVESLMYALTYVDNGAFTGTADEVRYTYTNLNSIFNPYGFEIQQVETNDRDL